jgi:hypothetical protein
MPHCLIAGRQRYRYRELYRAEGFVPHSDGSVLTISMSISRKPLPLLPVSSQMKLQRNQRDKDTMRVGKPKRTTPPSSSKLAGQFIRGCLRATHKGAAYEKEEGGKASFRTLISSDTAEGKRLLCANRGAATCARTHTR